MQWWSISENPRLHGGRDELAAGLHCERFAAGLRRDYDAVRAGLTLEHRSGRSREPSTRLKCSSGKCAAAPTSTYSAPASCPRLTTTRSRRVRQIQFQDPLTTRIRVPAMWSLNSANVEPTARCCYQHCRPCQHGTEGVDLSSREHRQAKAESEEKVRPPGQWALFEHQAPTRSMPR